MASDQAMLIEASETAAERASQTRWLLDRASMVIGRHSSAEIMLPDRQISRQHARIRRTAEAFVIQDLGSKNGTFVNGQAVTAPVSLKDGDVIQIGLAYRFIFVDAEATVPLAFDAAESFALRLDEDKKQVWVNGHPVEPPLSPAQFEVLKLLAMADGGIVGREAIVTTVWGAEASEGVTEQAIDALVRRLRRRLEELAPGREFIVTVRGHGFRLEK